MSSPNTGDEIAALPYGTQYSGSVSLVASTFVSGISWGFMTSVYVVCMYSLIRNFRSTKAPRKTTFLTLWVTILWTLSSISTITNAYSMLYAYSWKLDFPGGPFVYLLSEQGKPVPALAYIAYLLTMWIADAMMLWRLVVCYRGVHFLTRCFVLCFMFLVYIASIGTGCYTLVLSSSDQVLFSALSRKAAIPCITLSVTLNVFATAFIVIRLLLYKRLMARNLGKRQARESPYTSITAMLVESSALYGTWSLVFIIVYALCTPGEYIMLTTLSNVQVIAPLLIVYRVSRGMAWEETASTKITSTHSRSASSGYDSRGRSDMVVVMHTEQQQVLWESSSKTMTSGPWQPQAEYEATSV